MVDFKYVRPETFKYAQERFEEDVDNLLDDPYGMFPFKDQLQEGIKKMRALAEDLELDFDELVKKNGTEYEIQLLEKLEHGAI